VENALAYYNVVFLYNGKSFIVQTQKQACNEMLKSGELQTKTSTPNK